MRRLCTLPAVQVASCLTPQPQYLYVTYAAAFLLKVGSHSLNILATAPKKISQLLDSRFDALVDHALRESIVNDVYSIIRVWSSADVALDKQHAPYIYSRFLSSLLEDCADGRDRVIGGPESRGPPAVSWSQAPRSASPQSYDAGPSGYQTAFDADPLQFVQASHRGDAFAFQKFVTNVKAAQSGWPASPEPLPKAAFYDPPATVSSE